MTPSLMGLHTLLVFFVAVTALKSGDPPTQRLLVILLDGFRWDYVSNKDNLPGFKRLKKYGSHVEKIKPVFPADCYPNIYSLFTGVYPAAHGVISNRVYDFENKEEFDHQSHFTHHQRHLWVDVDPIWTRAKKQEKRVSLYHLPTCQSSMDVHSPFLCVPYLERDMAHFGSTLQYAFNTLVHNSSQMAVVYNNQMDALAHRYGPESLTLEEELLPQLDKNISLILDQIDDHPINLIVLSDHGMSQIAQRKEIILDRYISRSTIHKIVNTGVTASIWPNPGLEEEVFSRIAEFAGNKLKVYRKADIPAHWQMKEHRLTPPILIVADEGYFIISRELTFPMIDQRYPASGWHGYSPDNEEMHFPFFFYGPSAERGVTLPSLDIVDLYQLMCHVIGLHPGEEHRGNWTRVLPLITASSHRKYKPFQVVKSSKSGASDPPTCAYLMTALSCLLTLLFS